MKIYIVHRYDGDCPYVIKATFDKNEAESIKKRFSNGDDYAYVAELDMDADTPSLVWCVVFWADGEVKRVFIDDSSMYDKHIPSTYFWRDGICYSRVVAENMDSAIKLASALRKRVISEKEEK